jgi:hypothetical protein
MSERLNRPITGNKPVPRHDESEFRDDRDPRMPFVKTHGSMIDIIMSSERDDDEYFPVPEVLDEP